MLLSLYSRRVEEVASVGSYLDYTASADQTNVLVYNTRHEFPPGYMQDIAEIFSYFCTSCCSVFDKHCLLVAILLPIHPGHFACHLML